MKGQKVYLAPKIFNGEQWLSQQAIIVRDGIIESVMPVSETPTGFERVVFDQEMLVPAFIDLQIYGAFGKLFSVYPDIDALNKLNEYSRAGGAAFFLPTLATNSYEIFYRGIDAVRNYWNAGGQGILGIHLEGPWINSQKRGAHIEAYIHKPAMKQVKELLAYGKGVIKMITLAPEICSPEIIEELLANNIVISAGHSNATFEEAMNGFKLGIKSVTHLYNAMSPLQHHAPGLVGAAMQNETIMASIIPDGYHVDFAAISIAKKIMHDRLFVITDAVTETGTGNYPHTLNGNKYEVAGILSGSALTMDKAVKNLVHDVGIDAGEAIRMCSWYPARLLGMDNQLGKIQKGYQAKLLALDEQFKAIKILE